MFRGVAVFTMTGGSSQPPLLVDKHEKYIYDLDTPDKALTMDFVLSESIRMGGAYWGITALDVLGKLDAQSYTRRDDVLNFIDSCRGQDGGYGFFPGMDSHINSTHYALLVLAELDALDTLSPEERLETRRFVISMQTSDGGFQGDYSGEVDGRFSYSAVAILSLLNAVGAPEDIDRQRAVAWLRSCQNYDGAFGSIPGAESHAAYTFCAVAALALLGEEADEIDNWRLGHWLAERQIPKHGGFNGRPEKAPDVCYSWWITSALSVLGKLHWIDSDALTGFILRAQEEEDGGIADRPGDVPDVFHTFFGLAGLSLLDTSGSFHLRPVDPVWALPLDTVRRLGLATGKGRSGGTSA
ncbi:Geranylgeranyl transferase type-2 subunit beta, putative [Perkinsus marinus ATCC 50983]|uniref:Geranylgeranyl transferase type-2 subunit beta n=1 Tax=Perkinsus marinus (strain ATCC 50983 / TXsc) TaxID=423536 RepID=C5L007_PERM5|nr:Geranylgeranyl transferase type-2 subunit beta, putative [Perkinsus marinus ATCC 50983]EER09865.1 Geranylgeranyl transferase type-2 subunit beta, putative [Perkinsus marinus ATCC 50983]|eukprot:XP_002778070.1 Geranylgeranyl transferase type-2 subunit beta, putative [Perkinsus marinus ATCC 50983]